MLTCPWVKDSQHPRLFISAGRRWVDKSCSTSMVLYLFLSWETLHRMRVIFPMNFYRIRHFVIALEILRNQITAAVPQLGFFPAKIRCHHIHLFVSQKTCGGKHNDEKLRKSTNTKLSNSFHFWSETSSHLARQALILVRVHKKPADDVELKSM